MYKLSNTGVIRKTDGAYIPAVNGNVDWDEYQEWLAKGNTPEPEYYTAEEIKERETRALKEALFNDDFNMPRLVEDLLDLLILKKVVSLNDLPLAAQAKFKARKEARKQLESIK